MLLLKKGVDKTATRNLVKCLMQSIWLLFLFLPMQMMAQSALSSPDKKIVFALHLTNGQLSYSIHFDGSQVIEPSSMGITINKVSIGNNVVKGKTSFYKKKETYPFRGVHSVAVNHYNGIKQNYSENGISFSIEARVFNDGVAFRYIVMNNDSATVDREQTTFVVPASAILWSQNNIKYYEGRYSKILADTIKPGMVMGPPVTIELPGDAGYAAIAEGGLTDFGGMSLQALGNRRLQSNLSGVTKKYGNVETPWRVIEIGKDLNTMVNCDIIANVSPPYDKKLFQKGYATDWIKPGRSVWSWLAKSRAITLSNMKYFSDLASQLGFEYNLVDEGWSSWRDSVNHRDHWDMMKELVEYSAKKGVKIWVWKAYPDRAGIAGINTTAKRKTFFQKCFDIGIVGLKIDFFDDESQEIINFYQAALKDAAQYQLMIDFHGSNKPTGETRTYPNEMTREGVRGLENRPPWAAGNATLPFTRYLAGHGDYTPIHFGDRIGELSWSHLVASAVVFTSPFLCYGADPQSILDNPAKEMIKSLPSTWDQTIVLHQSKIGELAVFARRKENVWFLAVVNGANESKTIVIDLSFLNKGSFSLSSMADENGRQANAIFDNKMVTSAAELTITVNPNGGYVARLNKASL